MILFWVFWGIDAIVALVVLYFFFEGLADNTVSAFNITQWLVLLAVLAALLVGTLTVKGAGHMTLAKVLTGIVAIPAFLFFLFFAILIGSGTKWN